VTIAESDGQGNCLTCGIPCFAERCRVWLSRNVSQTNCRCEFTAVHDTLHHGHVPANIYPTLWRIFIMHIIEEDNQHNFAFAAQLTCFFFRSRQRRRFLLGFPNIHISSPVILKMSHRFLQNEAGTSLQTSGFCFCDSSEFY
jgi:hypothetical protein